MWIMWIMWIMLHASGPEDPFSTNIIFLHLYLNAIHCPKNRIIIIVSSNLPLSLI